MRAFQSIVQNWKVFDFWKLYEVNHLKHLYSSGEIREMGCSCESMSIIIFPWIVGSVLNIVVFFTSGCATSKSFWNTSPDDFAQSLKQIFWIELPMSIWTPHVYRGQFPLNTKWSSCFLSWQFHQWNVMYASSFPGIKLQGCKDATVWVPSWH